MRINIQEVYYAVLQKLYVVYISIRKFRKQTPNKRRQLGSK